MIRLLQSLIKNRTGSAAVEMALVFPFLVVLLLGAVDVGNYFLSEHVVDKAVRDASRYAARLPLSDYPSCTSVDSTTQTQIQRLARTGDPSGTVAKLPGWTADSMTTVSIACDTTSSWADSGIYADFPDGAPVVTVSATVPYSSLFGSIGMGALTFNLYAESQAAVIGA